MNRFGSNLEVVSRSEFDLTSFWMKLNINETRIFKSKVVSKLKFSKEFYG